MIRSLIRLGVILGIIALIYYRFFGNEQEKATSKEVITKGTDVAKSLGKLTWTMLKRGKENLDSGKYEDTVENISALIDDLKDKAETLEEGKEIYDKIKSLESRRDELQKEIAVADVSSYGSSEEKVDSSEQKEKIKDITKSLLKDTEALMHELENE